MRRVRPTGWRKSRCRISLPPVSRPSPLAGDSGRALPRARPASSVRTRCWAVRCRMNRCWRSGQGSKAMPTTWRRRSLADFAWSCGMATVSSTFKPRSRPACKVVLFVPDFEMPTNEGRKLLPATLSKEDAVHNIGRAALLVAALVRGEWSVLDTATQDRLHQPARTPLFSAMPEIFAAAKRCRRVVCLSFWKRLDDRGIRARGDGCNRSGNARGREKPRVLREDDRDVAVGHRGAGGRLELRQQRDPP